jgi:hypothetical protein
MVNEQIESNSKEEDMNFHEAEFRKIFEQAKNINASNVKYVEDCALCKLSNGLILKAYFSNTDKRISGTVKNLIVLNIICKTSGAADRQEITFAHIWGKKAAPDTRQGCVSPEFEKCYEWEWNRYFTPAKQDYKILADSIDDYVSVFM